MLTVHVHAICVEMTLKTQTSDKAVTLLGISGFRHVLSALFDLHVPFPRFYAPPSICVGRRLCLGNPTDEVKGGGGWGSGSSHLAS